MSDQNHSQQLVQKLWNYCNILRDDGLSYGDYVEQLTFLLFLKMADEQSRPPFKKPSTVPKGYDWPSLLTKDGVPLDGDALEVHYRHVLETLGKKTGRIGKSKPISWEILQRILRFFPGAGRCLRREIPPLGTSGGENSVGRRPRLLACGEHRGMPLHPKGGRGARELSFREEQPHGA
jgi:hypothetical protein